MTTPSKSKCDQSGLNHMLDEEPLPVTTSFAEGNFNISCSTPTSTSFEPRFELGGASDLSVSEEQENLVSLFTQIIKKEKTKNFNLRKVLLMLIKLIMKLLFLVQMSV
jgi:hypothetical protein